MWAASSEAVSVTAARLDGTPDHQRGISESPFGGGRVDVLGARALARRA